MSDAKADIGSNQVVVTEGRSMMPLIRAGTRATLRRCGPTEVRPGDLIAFRQEDKIVIHRLLQTRENGAGILMREKGDSNAVSTWVDQSRLVGKAVRLERDRKACCLESVNQGWACDLITIGSRGEAVLFELLIRLKTRALGRGTSPITRVLAKALRLILLPAKLVAAPLFLLAYRWQPVKQDAQIPKFLLHVFRVLNGEEERLPADLCRNLDGPELVEALEQQGILPQAFPLLDGLVQGNALPTRVAEEARKRRYRRALVHMTGAATLQDIHETLTRCAIPYAIIKGPGLSLQLYDAGAPRSYGDVDVVVRRRDREAALAALTETAFRTAGGRVVQRLVRLGHFHIVLDPARKGRLKVELHWSLVDRANLYRIREEDVFSRLRTVAAEGSTFSALAIEHELMYLCLHLVKHAVLNEFGLTSQEPPEWFCRGDTGNRLLWFLDIHLFLKKYESAIDWNRLRETAERWNTLPEICQSLAILQRLLPGSPAAAALDRLAVPPAVWMSSSRSVPARLFNTESGRKLIERSMVINKDFTLRPVRFLFLGRLLFPPPVRLLQYYRQRRPWLLPLLYVVHPFLILRKQITW